jgi:hypothetical protein
MLPVLAQSKDYGSVNAVIAFFGECCTMGTVGESMQTLQIGIIHPKAMNLLQELDSLKLIAIMPQERDGGMPAENGETVIENPKRPVFGCAKGQFCMSGDFDAPLEDFAGYMS